ncbi:Rrf2 family transcriptional regulator [soil metagenome]
MRRDSRLSLVLHALLHMRELGLVTSETMAKMLHTNPVVVRRTMAGLREAGFVQSEKGHGGGWKLVRKLDDITLGDVYDAIASPPLFSIGPRVESPGCLIEQAVDRVVGSALDEAEALVLTRLRAVTVAEIVTEAKRHGPLAKRTAQE